MAVRFQLRRDTAANWASANSVLALGEPGVETDTLKVKVGDGSTAWNSLAYSITKDFTDLTSKPTTLAGYGITDSLALNALSVTQNAASGNGTLTYNNATGVFSYTPPDFEGLTGNFTGSVFADDSTVMVDGVSATINLANNTTTDLTEGTNLYYTDGRADARIAAASITDLSDADQTVQTTDDVTFNSVTGNIITSQIDSADSSAIEIQTDVTMLAGLTVGNHIIPSSNQNIDLGSASNRFRDLYLSGNSAIIGDLALKRHISGGLLVADHSTGNPTNVTTHNITANDITAAGDVDVTGNLTMTGYIAGPATMTIDPAAVGDNTGTLVVAGNLQVDGTTTTINSQTLEVEDKNVVLGPNAANDAANNGAGLTVTQPDTTDATLIYNTTDTQWELNKDVNVGSNDLQAARILADSATTPQTIYYVSSVEKGYSRINSEVLEHNGTAGVMLRHNGFEKLSTTTAGINVTGNLLLTSNNIIGRNTSDASDNGYIAVVGGGAESDGRGAIIRYYGNEHATNPGRLSLGGGNVTNADITFRASGVDLGRMDPDVDLYSMALSRFTGSSGNLLLEGDDTVVGMPGIQFKNTADSLNVNLLYRNEEGVEIRSTLENDSGVGNDLLTLANTRVNTGSSAAGIKFVTNEISGSSQYVRAKITAEYDDSSNLNGRLLFSTSDSSGNIQNRVTIKGDGNVGIGETDPNHILHLKTSAAGGPQIELTDDDTIDNSGFINFDGTNLQLSTSRDMVDGSWRDTGKSWGGINIQGPAAGSQITFTTASGANSAPATRLTIDKDGDATFSQNLRMGSRAALSPTTFGYNASWKALILGSTGTSYQTDAVTISMGYNPSGNPSGSYTGTGSEILFRNNARFLQPNSTDDGYLNTFAMNNGDVGIGDTDPDAKLSVGAGTEATYVHVNNASTGDVSSGYNIISGSTTTTSLYGNAGEGWTTLLSGGALNFRVNNAVSGFNPLGIATDGTVNFTEIMKLDGNNAYFISTATNGYRFNNSNDAFNNMIIAENGNVTIRGALSKGSGSFRIPHPVASKTATHDLVHSFLEAPQADNLYRGKVDLVAGTATVNIDTVAGMTEGTFAALNREVQCFTSNETGWTAVKGSVSGNMLTITAQDSSCTDTISWMVVGERKDQHMYDTDWTDDNGKVIVEPTKRPDKI